MVILLTFCTLFSALSAQIAYLPYPTPLYVLLALLVFGAFVVFLLPEPINYKVLEDEAPNKQENEAKVLSGKAHHTFEQDESTNIAFN